MKGLATSGDSASSAQALEKADNYIHLSKQKSRISQDRTLINKTSTTGKTEGGVSVGGADKDGVTSDSEASQAAFLHSMEEDARERGERRRERERRGKEAKRKGNKAFKKGDLQSAVECFTEAIREMPWDITLYTNRALVRPQPHA